MKSALKRKQDVFNISLQNVFDTGVNSVAKALEIWEEECTDFNPPKKGKDGHYFLGRTIQFIEPNSESEFRYKYLISISFMIY